jgi:hypothetical protein
MEILKKRPVTRGRFFDLLLGSRGCPAEKSAGSIERVSLSLENEVLGNWLCVHRQPLADVLRRLAH